MNGLYRYNKKEDRFLPFFESESAISTDACGGFEEDSDENLWVCTLSGLVKINPDRSGYILYGKKYGIENVGDIKKTLRGEFLVTKEDGFYTFYPQEMNAASPPLNLVISDFFFNRLAGVKGSDSSYLTTIENKNAISLSYNQNNFGLRFTANDYRSLNNIRYFTQMENYDPEWRLSGPDRSAFYFNLAPGDYVFRVKAYNSDEIKGEREIKIHIHPPWWKTGWAYAAYVLIGLSLIFSIARLQKMRIVREERQKRQSFELEQAKEIEKAYTELKATQAQLIQSEKMASLGELTAGIAHEIQNPLNFVNNFSEVNLELTQDLKEELAKLGISGEQKLVIEEIADNIDVNQQKINHHGKRADAIVKGMLQHSRVSSGLKEPTNINQLADEYLRLAFHGLRAKDNSFNSVLKTSFDEHIGIVNLVPQDIGRVLLNLFNNAFYAVAEKKRLQPSGFEPEVEVDTKKTGQWVEILVRDNGNGIPKKVLDKIFQPFFTTKPTGQGTGLGLSLSFDIVKAHGGEIVVDTVEGRYTVFTVRLPA